MVMAIYVTFEKAKTSDKDKQIHYVYKIYQGNDGIFWIGSTLRFI